MHDTDGNNTREDPRDPLGLRALPPLEPGTDGWPAIRSTLAAERARRRAPRAWLAAAACLVIVAGVLLHHRPPEAPATRTDEPAVSTRTGEAAAATPAGVSVDELIALSQLLERRLLRLRTRTGALPADSAAYVAELEDLITRVDSELSDTPYATGLWRQRVNLLLDLETLFKHQFDREYGRMASL